MTAAQPRSLLLEREQLLELGQDLGLPASWRAQAARATAAVERTFLLRGLRRRLLVATPHGRARLRSWLDQQQATPGTPTPPWLVPRLIRERVLFFGDVSIRNVVGAALSQAPAAVRDSALSEVVFLGVGRESYGWCGSANLRDRDGEGRPSLVVLGPNVDIARVLHEVGHVWFSAPPHEFSQLVSARGEERLFALATREGWMPRAEAIIARAELLADAAAIAWSEPS